MQTAGHFKFYRQTPSTGMGETSFRSSGWLYASQVTESKECCRNFQLPDQVKQTMWLDLSLVLTPYQGCSMIGPCLRKASGKNPCRYPRANDSAILPDYPGKVHCINAYYILRTRLGSCSNMNGLALGIPCRGGLEKLRLYSTFTLCYLSVQLYRESLQCWFDVTA